MKIILKIVLSAIIIFAGVLLAFAINFYLISDLIIGEPLSYAVDSTETGYIFNLFYEISSDTGYMPEPSILNWILTLLIGVTIGIIAARKIIP